jgi:5-methylthioadenosine/S-adenosylhomocysteine deaminase
MPPSLLVRSGTVLTMNDRLDIVEGDVSIRDGWIEKVGAIDPAARHDKVIDAAGGYVLPGLIQTHVHLCQTLFRGAADDRPLLDWLRTRIWPLEAAHTADTLRASARLAAAELLLSGTTSVLTMETVHDTEAVFEAVAPTGLRATIGKCMMDAAPGAPARLQETTHAAIDESLALIKRWPGRETGSARVRAAFAPRFAVSCSRELLEAIGALSREHHVVVHTHASESRDELAIVRERSNGLDNIAYFEAVALAGPRLCAAHCVWVDDREQALLAAHDIKVLHCPGSNLKLGSGLAPVADLRRRGVTVSIGADGAACNNRLDMFEEMRLAALVAALRGSPGALTARDALWMATRSGARTLGLEDELGSIEAGRRADLIVVARGRPHLAPDADAYSTLVYAARGSDVSTVVVDGRVVVDRGAPVDLDVGEIVSDARNAWRRLLGRAAVS